MINNRVEEINEKQLHIIKEKVMTNTKILFVELDGKDMYSWDDYITAIQEKFHFPSSCNDNMDQYLDWIRDLSWLKEEEYIIVIHHFESFLQNNKELKDEIMSDYKDTILPFWEEEVLQVVAEGKAKSFIVYVVK